MINQKNRKTISVVMICKNEEVIKKHAAKVYGKAEVGAPPMSVPHLDTRIINGKKALLFGPYAGFSTKFLKHGSYMDLPASLQLDNLIPIVSAGLHNITLTKYLIDQVRQSPEDRLEALKKFVPTAKLEDWVLEEAGQRVQVIKKDHEEGGVVEFGDDWKPRRPYALNYARSLVAKVARPWATHRDDAHLWRDWLQRASS